MASVGCAGTMRELLRPSSNSAPCTSAGINNIGSSQRERVFSILSPVWSWTKVMLMDKHVVIWFATAQAVLAATSCSLDNAARQRTAGAATQALAYASRRGSAILLRGSRRDCER